jgi:uncharacterized damage-inducible protein DinB
MPLEPKPDVVEESMKSKVLLFLAFMSFVLAIGPSLRGQEKPATGAPSAPTSGYRAEFLDEIASYEQKFVRLAEATPAEKYSWRPGEGVRSAGEVFNHIAIANYFIARALGTPVPAGFDPAALGASANDKAKTVQALKNSFAHFRQAILALSDADADKPQKMFGHQTTLRGSFILISGHMGEHLGQSIAYARVNGIVPPWTEDQQQRQQQEKKQLEKPKQ